MQEDRINIYNKNNVIVFTAIICLVTIAVNILSSFLYKKELGELIEVGVFSTISSLIFLYVFSYGLKSDLFDYDNIENPYRFLLAYGICFVVSTLVPLMPVGAWPFLSVAVVLSVFSNTETGLSALISLLTVPCMLTLGQSLNVFFVYVLIGILGILFFKNLDDDFNVNGAMVILSITAFVIEFAGFVLLKNEVLSFEQLLPLFVNIGVNLIILFPILKYFNGHVVNKFTSRLLELNDQEFIVLRKMKEEHLNEYYRTIHTTHLTDIIASQIGLDVLLTKNLSYYHRIKFVNEFDNDECREFLNEYSFPPEAKRILMDYYTFETIYEHKECYIVFLCSKFVALLQKMFTNNPKKDVDWEKLIHAFLEEEYKSSMFMNSSLTQRDYTVIKDILLKESLYYDFIR